MSRILLVYPRFPETFWGYQRALRFLGISATHPPLGMLTVAGMLPGGHDLRMVDLNVRSDRNEDWEWADLVLTGGMMIQRPSVEQVVARSRQHGVPVVIGGPDATTCSEDLPSDAHLVLGEAESPRFAHAIDQLVRSRKRLILDLREEPQGIDDSPLPRYDIIDRKDYASMALQMSRGCPFKCEFCDIPFLFGNRTRYKPVDRTLAELELLYDWGWRGSVFWVDDNFIGNKKSCKDILPHVIEWQQNHGMPFQFYTQASVNLAADESLLDLMGDAGFDSVFLGIETPVEESLIETRKLQNTRFDLLESVQKIQGKGMQVMAGFIIGFDNDPDDIDDHLIRFIQDSGIPVAMTGLLTALPGSPLYDRLETEGRLLETNAEREGNNTFQFAFNYKTKQNPQTLIDAYKRVLLEVYGKPENYFKRVETLYRNLGQKSITETPLDWRRLLALVRSILMIPWTRYGRVYGSFLARTLLKSPSRFQDAVRQGIIGLHFYQLTRDRLAIHEFDTYLSAAIERVHEACEHGRQEGVRLAMQAIEDGRKRLRRLPATARVEMQALYEEFELTLHNLALSLETA